jgi:hypothetical protein
MAAIVTVAWCLHVYRSMEDEAKIGIAAVSPSLAYHQRGFAMPRANLVSLMELFAKFGGGAAVVQRRGYRREKRTYAELFSDAIFWSFVLGVRGIVAGDRHHPTPAK